MKRLLFAGFTILIALVAICAAPKSDNSNFKHEFLNRINLARQKGCNCGTTYFPPAPPLSWNDELEDAARGHALDMSERNYFSHTSKSGRNVSDRVLAAGYGFKGYRSYAVGENIAQGQMSIAEVMDGWLRSEGAPWAARRDPGA